MEALMSLRVFPIRACSRQQHVHLIPVFSSRVISRVFITPVEGMMKPCKSSNLRVTSIQPLEVLSSLGRFDNTLPSKEVLELWQNADAVCFDVNSTVCLDEGIDELAEFCGAGKAVAEWTARAMNGSVPFEEALAARLSLFNPSLSQVQNFLERPPRISPAISELVKKLKDSGKTVYLISGGFRQMINIIYRIWNH